MPLGSIAVDGRRRRHRPSVRVRPDARRLVIHCPQVGEMSIVPTCAKFFDRLILFKPQIGVSVFSAIGSMTAPDVEVFGSSTGCGKARLSRAKARKSRLCVARRRNTVRERAMTWSGGLAPGNREPSSRGHALSACGTRAPRCPGAWPITRTTRGDWRAGEARAIARKCRATPACQAPCPDRRGVDFASARSRSTRRGVNRPQDVPRSMAVQGAHARARPFEAQGRPRGGEHRGARCSLTEQGQFPRLGFSWRARRPWRAISRWAGVACRS
jgi:hypothetical protein